MAEASKRESGPDALVEQRGHTLIVTLNRPHARNALSTEMMEIMVAGLGPRRQRRRHPVLHPDRGRWLLLRGHGPQGGNQEAAG